MKILILMPDPARTRAGVVVFLEGLSKRFHADIHRMFVGGRSRQWGGVIRQLVDYGRYFFRLLHLRPDLIHLNPSLNPKAVIRDAVYLWLGRLTGRRILVFWHGWRESYARRITRGGRWWFTLVFNRASAFCVLAEDFRTQLRGWGIKRPVYLETTCVDDSLLEDFNPDNRPLNKTILFLARVEAVKGIFVALEAMTHLPEYKLLVGGEGSALSEARALVRKGRLRNVHFLGEVAGESKRRVFLDSSVYLLPTWHGEGMPVALLEAMAMGMPVITRPVGGIKDFFQEGKMGHITPSRDPVVFAEFIRKILMDRSRALEISRYNHRYAVRRFLASRVAARLGRIYTEVFQG